MPLYYDHAGITIYHGDCLDIQSEFSRSCAVVSDPPYGMKWNGKVTRGKSDLKRKGTKTSGFDVKIINDDVPFDPKPFLRFEEVVLWGFHHFANNLPKGSVLVWIKRYDDGFGSFLSDADLAWMKGGHGVYCKRDLTLNGESRFRLHPTQKPLGIMKWCVEKTKGETIFDPFMGSGTTLVAAKELGRKAIGIEIEEKYCEIAAKRLSQEVMPF